jgi:hypothetical protein
MRIFNSLFGKSNKVDDKVKNINLLNSTMRQNEAKTETVLLLRELMQNPLLINGVEEVASFGNFLTNQFTIFNNSNELQFLAEIAFFTTSKELKRKLDPNILYDRLIVLYNAEDFITDTIIESSNFEQTSLGRMGSRHHIRWMADDMLLKMRFHDLFYENKFWPNGANANTFNGQEYLDILNRIQHGSFESKEPIEIVKIGSTLINKCFNHIANKYSIS